MIKKSTKQKGLKLTKREREKEKQKQKRNHLKQVLMKRGDKRQAKYSKDIFKPAKKPISWAKEVRLRLKNMNSQQMYSFVEGKCLISSRIYLKEGIKASKIKFDYYGFKSDFGVRLYFTEAGSERRHDFGFELLETYTANMMRIYYAAIRSDNVNYLNHERVINPKKFSSRTLLKMIGENK